VVNELGHGANECDDALVPDTVNGCSSLREVYELAHDETGKYSTPVLWCRRERTIVCNESLEILRMLDSSFNDLATRPEVSLFPTSPEVCAELDRLNEFIYPNVNNGVYRCGFARTQGAYESALKELFDALDRLEQHLLEGEGPYLTGKEFTWLDLRLWHTLVRFDPVYHTYFNTNLRRIADYPGLLGFLRRIYKIPAVRCTTNMRHIKMHYFTSHPTLNTYGIIPASNGPDLENLHNESAGQ
jgi:putative glutathione S-transferase